MYFYSFQKKGVTVEDKTLTAQKEQQDLSINSSLKKWYHLAKGLCGVTFWTVLKIIILPI